MEVASYPGGVEILHLLHATETGISAGLMGHVACMQPIPGSQWLGTSEVKRAKKKKKERGRTKARIGERACKTFFNDLLLEWQEMLYPILTILSALRHSLSSFQSDGERSLADIQALKKREISLVNLARFKVVFQIL